MNRKYWMFALPLLSVACAVQPASSEREGADLESVGATSEELVDDVNKIAVLDFDGDGIPDIVTRSGSYWVLDYGLDGYGSHREWHQLDISQGHMAPADYDGDGRADMALKFATTGQWCIDFASNGFSANPRARPELFDICYNKYGFGDATPVPADYDGDRKADLAVKTTRGEWFIDYSGDGFNGWNVMNWSGYGNGTAVPVPADYDGDGKADMSVKNYGGEWGIDYAVDGFNGWNVLVYGYGNSTAHPVPADYDGDGKADLSIKNDGGQWGIDYAKTEFKGWDVLVNSHGGSASYIPIPADYDRDGKADMAALLGPTLYIDFASNEFNDLWGVTQRCGDGLCNGTETRNTCFTDCR